MKSEPSFGMRRESRKVYNEKRITELNAQLRVAVKQEDYSEAINLASQLIISANILADIITAEEQSHEICRCKTV